MYLTIVMQDATTGENWMKGIQDLSIISYNYTQIYNYQNKKGFFLIKRNKARCTTGKYCLKTQGKH